MKVQYVSPFVNASISVMQTVISVTPARGQLSARPQMFTSQQLSIVCGIVGDVQGNVIYGMSMPTALGIAGKMIGAPAECFDQLTASAIAELGNMISGNAMNLLSSEGYTCDITPPTLVKGTNVSFSTLNIPALVIPLQVGDIGELEISVSLQEVAAQAA